MSLIPGQIPFHSGKVRQLFRTEDAILLVASDRISAFDFVLPTLIPNKGRLLTQMSIAWFALLEAELSVKHHFLDQIVPGDWLQPETKAFLQGRVMRVQPTEVIPVECIVRGYLAGSGWKEYHQSNKVQGHILPSNLLLSSQLPEALFTPTTKAQQGHDLPLSWDECVNTIGLETAEELRSLSLKIYSHAREYAAERGIILADTKFEFGRDAVGQLVLVDECLTPDSSRFWPVDRWCPGTNPPSFDKQFVRDYLSRCGWNFMAPAPELPPEVVTQTVAKYEEALYRLFPDLVYPAGA
ncbi:MAG: phosphoribosylaminoimidazolesuccinocarboxamide synthase [Verrucomicrobiales bacterium]